MLSEHRKYTNLGFYLHVNCEKTWLLLQTLCQAHSDSLFLVQAVLIGQRGDIGPEYHLDSVFLDWDTTLACGIL